MSTEIDISKIRFRITPKGELVVLPGNSALIDEIGFLEEEQPRAIRGDEPCILLAEHLSFAIALPESDGRIVVNVGKLQLDFFWAINHKGELVLIAWDRGYDGCPDDQRWIMVTEEAWATTPKLGQALMRHPSAATARATLIHQSRLTGFITIPQEQVDGWHVVDVHCPTIGDDILFGESYVVAAIGVPRCAVLPLGCLMRAFTGSRQLIIVRDILRDVDEEIGEMYVVLVGHTPTGETAIVSRAAQEEWEVHARFFWKLLTYNEAERVMISAKEWNG